VKRPPQRPPREPRPLSLRQKLLVWVARRAWRAAAIPDEQMPTGIPGNRDPEHPCEAFAPRPKNSADWGGCESDGHYLCRECAHMSREARARKEERP
jgi:hypothetical protein